MTRELARKRPAQVLPVRPIVHGLGDGQVQITHRHRTAVTEEVGRMWKARQIERDYDLWTSGAAWTATVRLAPPRSAWRRWGWKVAAAGAGAVAAAALLAGAVYLIVMAIVAALPVVAALLAVLAVAAMLSGLSSGGKVIEIVQSVRIKG